MKRVFYIFTIFIFISFILLGSVLSYLARSYLHQTTEDKVKRDLAMLAITTEGALANNDYERVEEQVLLWGEMEPHITLFEVILDGDIEIVKFAREIQTSNILCLSHTETLPTGRIITFSIEYDLSDRDKRADVFNAISLSINCCIAAVFIFLLWRILQRLAFIPLNREITERKLAEEALKVSHERFVAIMDSLDSLVYVADFVTHEVLFVNQFGRNVWGDVVGKKCWQTLQADQTGQCEFCTNDRLLDENGQATGVYVLEHQNTVNNQWYECHDQAIPWTDGRFVRMQIATDITERKQAEEAILAKTEEMEILLRAVSHDLRSPLVNIDGFSVELAADCEKVAEILEHVTADEKTKQQLKTLTGTLIPESLSFIRNGTKKMDALLAALSHLAKAGTVKLDIQRLDVNDITQQAVDTMKFSARKVGATIKVETLPDCLGDEVQINQIFSNLIGNAVKYLDPEREGQIRISGKVEGDMAHYCVEDNGVGIPDYHKTKVFEIFHRVDLMGSVSGDGIGLTTTKKIVERHNGRIWIESEEGKGSKFFVAIPA